MFKTQLDLRKLAANLVPRNLSDAAKLARRDLGRRVLDRFGDEWDEKIGDLLLVDEMWIYFDRPKGAKQAGRSKESPAKLTVTVFWNAPGVVYIDFLHGDDLITRNYFGCLLDEVREIISEATSREIVFLQGNAGAHREAQTVEKVQSFGWNLIPRPPHSPDLSPSDFHLYRALLNKLINRRYASGEELETAMKEYFQSKTAKFYEQGIQMLREQCTEIVEKAGDYSDNFDQK